MPEVPKADVLAALIVFRLLYLLIPLAMSCVVILMTERQGFVQALGALRLGGAKVAPAPAPVVTTDERDIHKRG